MEVWKDGWTSWARGYLFYACLIYLLFLLLSLSLSDRNVNRINRSTVLPRYVTPEAFEEYRLAALDMGFSYCASGPLVRSSYKAGEFFLEHMLADPNSRPCPPPPADHPVLQG